MAVAHRKLVTEEEFRQLPETMDKVELLEGEVVVSPSPSIAHQEILVAILTALRNWASSREEPVFVGASPLDVRLGPDRIVQPDAFVCLRAISRDEPTPLEVIPDVVVEVLSRDAVRDRVTKRYLYAEAGVEEYWIVEQTGAVERLTGDGLSKREIVDEVLRTPRLPGFELALSQLAGEA